MVKSIAVVPALAATVLGAALPQWGGSAFGGGASWSVRVIGAATSMAPLRPCPREDSLLISPEFSPLTP